MRIGGRIKGEGVRKSYLKVTRIDCEKESGLNRRAVKEGMDMVGEVESCDK